jgi:hypothetical protein
MRVETFGLRAMRIHPAVPTELKMRKAFRRPRRFDTRPPIGLRKMARIMYKAAEVKYGKNKC